MCSRNDLLLDEILEGPLTGGALDDDSYKGSMAGFIRLYFPAVEAKFGLTNRTTDERLADIIPVDLLATHLERVRIVRPELPPFDLSVRNDRQFRLTSQGVWSKASGGEIPAHTQSMVLPVKLSNPKQEEFHISYAAH